MRGSNGVSEVIFYLDQSIITFINADSPISLYVSVNATKDGVSLKLASLVST